MLFDAMGLGSKRDGSKVAALEARQNWDMAVVRSAVHELEYEVQRLNLLVKTLAGICQQKGVFTESEFKDLMDFIDVEDGELDGIAKKQVSPKECPKCGKKNNRMAKRCLYCEADLA